MPEISISSLIVKIPKSVLADYQLPPLSKLIYIVLLAYANKEGDCSLSNNAISEALGGITSACVTKHIKVLIERGYIKAIYKGKKYRKLYIQEGFNGHQ